MDHIGKIIFDTLVSGRGINLPEVGSLYVEREAAKFSGKNEIKPPMNRVLFSRKENERYESIVDFMTASEQGRSAAEAEYAQWLAKVRNDKGLLEISEVGVVKQNFFYPSAALHDTLNPGDQRSVKLKNNSAGRKWLIALLVVVCAAAVALGIWYGLKGKGGEEQTPPPVEEIVAPPVEDNTGEAAEGEAASPEDEIQRQLEEYASEGETGEGEWAESEAAPEKEPGTWIEEGKGSDAPAPDNAAAGKLSCWQKFLNIFRCKDKKRLPETPAVPDFEVIKVPTDQLEDPAPAVEEPPVVAGGTVYYVVAGVFSDPSNADKVILGNHLYLAPGEYKKMPYKGGKTMLVVYSSADKADAERRLKKLQVYDNSLWLYAINE